MRTESTIYRYRYLTTTLNGDNRRTSDPCGKLKYIDQKDLKTMTQTKLKFDATMCKFFRKTVASMVYMI